MEFSYEYYKANAFTWSLVACVVFGIISLGLIIKMLGTSNKSLKLQMFLCLVLSLFGLTSHVIKLSYSYKIVFDNKDNVMMVEGKIEKIEEVISSPVYKLEEGNSKASILYISGEKYYIMSAGNLSVNDNVEITYLKNSKFILEIVVDKTEDNGESE